MSDIDFLKQFRAESGLTQHELAQKVGVYVRTVRRWEAGDSKIPKATILFLKSLKKGIDT